MEERKTSSPAQCLVINMVQRKFTLIYYEKVVYGDLTSGIYQDAKVFYDMPLDFKINKATMLLENDQAWSKAISVQATIRPGQPQEIDELYDEDDIVSQDEAGSNNSYVILKWIAPDRIPLIVQDFGVLSVYEWESVTQHVNTYVKHSEHFVLDLVVKNTRLSQDTVSPTTGDFDLFVILDCEVL